MDSMLSKKMTEHRIRGDRRDAADVITRIQIFHSRTDAFGTQTLADLVAKKNAYILFENISRLIFALLRISEQPLASTFCNDNDSMMILRKSDFDCFDQSSGAVEFKINLRDQTEVHH